jgi:hypothetical protein
MCTHKRGWMWGMALALAMLLAACADGPASEGAGHTGSVVAHAVWPAPGSYSLPASGAGAQPMVAPPGVTTMRAIVSGAGMSNVVRSFAASAGSGVIGDVPAGLDRTLTLEGRDGSGNVLFQGINSGLSVLVGQTTDAGVVNMVPGSGVPYVLVTPGTTTLSEAGGTGTFTVKLNTAPDGDVGVNVYSPDIGEAKVSNGGAPATSLDLVFTTGTWSDPQTVTITGQEDFIVDGNQSFDIQLSINGSITTDTTGYASQTPAQVPDVPVTIVDADQPGVTVIPGTTTFSEAGGTGGFTVQLNTVPNGNVVIAVASQNTPKATVSASTLTFTTGNWNTPQPVTVTGVDNAINDGTVQVTIAVDVDTIATADTSGYQLLQPADVSDVTMNVTDNDLAGVTVTPGTTTFSENGGTGSFTVVLNSEPTGAVVITVASGDTTEALVKTGAGSPASSLNLSFSNLNWDTPQTVTVVGQDDSFVDGTINVLIGVNMNTSATTDSIYNAINPADVTVHVQDDEAPILYVKTPAAGGNDSNVGTIASPKATVRAAIQYLSGLGLTGEVHVALGSYNVTYPTTHVQLAQGISVYGGYNTTFTSRTPGSSTLSDTSSSGGSSSAPTRAVEAGAGITTATVFDGFTVTGGSGSYSAGIYITGSPTISRNHISGGSGSSGTYAVYIGGNAADLYDNTIRGGAGTQNVGIYATGSATARLLNNTISGGSGSGTACNFGIAFGYATSLTIENNILFSEETSTSCDWLIYEPSTSGETNKPASFYNNDLYGGDALYRNLVNGVYESETTIAAIDTALTTEGVSHGSNVSASPVFLNQAGLNWHLGPSSPTSVTQGGKTWSSVFTTDRDLVTRTVPWSIGAYEY